MLRLITKNSLKALLLGTAAGVLAAGSAEAAKPLQYVKICSLYGAGFYYIPGTDTCLKMGGWVRAEGTYGGNGSRLWGPFNANVNDRTTNNSTFSARGYITADARQQTEYGTLRSYLAVGIRTNDVGLNTAANQFSARRAFIQWAGFTAGSARSFYDFYDAMLASYNDGYLPSSDTGDCGWGEFGYTSQWGNGYSTSFSFEQRRMTQLINTNPGEFGVAGGGEITPGPFAPDVPPSLISSGGAYGGFQVPDVVGNLRVDQVWGSAQIMAGLHEVNSNYYDGPAVGSVGHPADAWGWAAGAGLRVNNPMASGDFFQTQVNFTEGALRYLNHGANSNWGKVDGTHEAYGVLSDGVFGGVSGTTATNIHLTKGWGVNASYEHYWSQVLHQSLYGGYMAVSYDSRANAMLCSAEGNGTGVGSAAVAAPGCDNKWSTWDLGIRVQWDITRDAYVGADVLYERLVSATPNATGNLGAGGLAIGGATMQASHEDNWAFTARMHKDFFP